MTDSTFYLLDALLAAAKGMLVSNRAKTIQQQYNLKEDPRSKLLQVGTHPMTNSLISFIGSYLINKDMVRNANEINKGQPVRYFQAQ